jgi:protein TonB
VIRQRIQEALVYPRAARRFGWEGTARVRIVLAPDGQLSNFTLEFSSKIGLLDREVLAAVQRAAPYPYVEGPIAIPVVFDLRAP